MQRREVCTAIRQRPVGAVVSAVVKIHRVSPHSLVRVFITTSDIYITVLSQHTRVMPTVLLLYLWVHPLPPWYTIQVLWRVFFGESSLVSLEVKRRWWRVEGLTDLYHRNLWTDEGEDLYTWHGGEERGTEWHLLPWEFDTDDVRAYKRQVSKDQGALNILSLTERESFIILVLLSLNTPLSLAFLF